MKSSQDTSFAVGDVPRASSSDDAHVAACAWPRAPTSCLGAEGEDPPPACCLDWTILGRGIRDRVLGLGLGLVAGERQALDRCQGPFQ